MSLSSEQFETFRGYVEDSSRYRERECQDFLIHAAELLLPGNPSRVVGVVEERNFFGETDFIIGAEIREDTNRVSRHAYIWELKAPQCYLFEFDTKNRCRPTDAYVQGENQLLHYFYEAAGNSRFRERLGIINQDNVHIGGLIIGTRARLVKGSVEIDKADTALKVRETYLYKADSIRVMTWDRVLDFVRPA